MKRIILTGGPGSGKTVISAAIAALEPGRYINVPEAATQIYQLLQTRWDLLDTEGRRDVQRRIYNLQREQEETLAAAHPDKILLLDRGTVDGSAYWPEGPDEYWREFNTTAGQELAKYDAVIWLQCSAAVGLYDRDASNACRYEPPDKAIALGESLKLLWRSHPQLRLVDAYPSLNEKIAAVLEILRAI